MKTSSVLMLAAATGELLAQVQGFAPTAGLLPGAQRSVAATKRASLFTPGAKRGGLGCKCPGGCRCAQKTQLRMSSLADDVNADFEELFEANRDWIDFKKAQDPEFFKKNAAEHKPSVLWIGCADSRVPSNEVIGAESGEIFTHRNIANVVMQTDQNLQGGLQYAVDALGVEHIVVCGHSNCGGIAASLTPTAFSPPLEGWLHHLANVYRLHASELDGIKDEKAKLRRLVELNVLEQCNNVAASSIVQAKQRESIAKGAPFPVPRIHGYVYDLENGALEDLQWSDQIADEGGVFKVRNDYAAMGMEDPNLKEKSMFNRKPAGMSGGGSVNPLKKMFGKK
mmetsp:Transcript_44940/g.112686  ORF Transcript_44940/g.112686 Transcript_44940/m.112686 type:complete len:339 (+) Transcript_44940:47-1063(+)